MRKPVQVWFFGTALVLAAVVLFVFLGRPATPRAQAFERARKQGLTLDLSETRPPKLKEGDARPLLEKLFTLVESKGSKEKIHAMILEASAKPGLTWDFRSSEPYAATAEEETKFYQLLETAHTISADLFKEGRNREALEVLAAMDQLSWKLLQNQGKHPQYTGSNLVVANVKGWAHALSQHLTLDELTYATEELEKTTGYRISLRLFLAAELASYRKFVQTRVTRMLQGKDKRSLEQVETLRSTEIVYAENLAKSFERLGENDRDFSAWRQAFEPESKIVLDPKHPSFKYLNAFWPNVGLITDMYTQSALEPLLLSTAAKMLLESKKDDVELARTQALANSRDPVTGKPFQFRSDADGFTVISPESGLMPSGMASKEMKVRVRFAQGNHLQPQAVPNPR